jgi:tetratricopeptide (TPR) repeat protein
VELLRQSGRLDEALALVDEWLAPFKHKPDWSDSLFLTGVTGRARLLYDLNRYEEALPPLKQLLDHLRGGALRGVDRLFLQSLIVLADTYSVLNKESEEKNALQEFVRHSGGEISKTLRVARASAQLRLVLLELSNGELKPAEGFRSLGAWFDEHQEILPSLPAEGVELAKVFHGLCDAEAQGKLPTADQLRSLFRIGLTNNSEGIASMFLSYAALFFRVIPAEELRNWLEQLLNADIHEEQKQQLRLHLRVTEFLQDAISQSSEARNSLRQKLGRVPPELQNLFKSLLSKLLQQT